MSSVAFKRRDWYRLPANLETLTLADLDAVFQAGSDFRLMSPEVTWRVSDAAPALVTALAATEPTIPRLLTQLESGLPVQKTWAFGEAGAFVRPDRHARAIYLDLRRLDSQPGQGCIAIKGSEAACDNFDQIVERLKHMWNVCGVTMGGLNRTIYQEVVMMNSMDRFPVTESVPPGVHLHASAIEEAEVGAEYQATYLGRYGELAKAPVPLMVLRWPDHISEKIQQRLAPNLAPRSRKIVNTVLKDGLGVFVYYYRSIPMRVIHLQAPDAGGWTHPRQAPRSHWRLERGQRRDRKLGRANRSCTCAGIRADRPDLPRPRLLHPASKSNR